MRRNALMHLNLMMAVFLLALPSPGVAYLPDLCVFPTELSCIGRASSNLTHVSFVLSNNVGYAVNIAGVGGPINGTHDCADATLISVNGLTTTQVRIENGGWAAFIVDCGTGRILEPNFDSFSTILTRKRA